MAPLPQPLKAPPPPGGTGNPSQDAIVLNQNMVNKQSSLIGAVGGKKKKGGAIEVATIKPTYTSTLAPSQGPVSQQLNSLSSINQSQVQGAKDSVPLVTGGKKKSKSKKTKAKKSNKSNKSKKSKRNKNILKRTRSRK
jgi:hypothetical protein